MKSFLPLLILSVFILTGCNQPSPEEPNPRPYDQNSWKDIISEDCQTFSDGCNTCQRMEDRTACTKKGCAQYDKPKCLDKAKNDSPYIGLTVEAAQAKAKATGTPFRVVEIDGEPQAVTMDYRPGRINASIKDGKVVDVSIE